MISLIPLVTAILHFCIGLRIVAFTSTHHRKKPLFSILAVLLVGFFLGSAVSIAVYGLLVTISEFVLSVILMVLIIIAKGNVAELFRVIPSNVDMGKK